MVIVTITFSRTFTSVCPSNLTEPFWRAAWKEIDGKLITQQRQEIQCQPYCARKGQKCPHDSMFPSLLRDNLTRGWMLTVPYPPEDKSRYFVQCEISNTILFRHGSDSSWRFWSCEQLLRFSCLLRPLGLRSLKMTIVAFFSPPRGIFPTTTGLSMWGCCHTIKCEQTLSAAQWTLRTTSWGYVLKNRATIFIPFITTSSNYSLSLKYTSNKWRFYNKIQ